MSTKPTARPRLNHLGLATSNLDAMIDWYIKVLGMSLNQRVAPSAPGEGPPFTLAFLSNDEAYQRLTLFGMPYITTDAEKSRHAGMQHFAFEHETLDDLLEAYARLKELNIVPVMALDEGVHICLYYQDPDRNNVELNANNYLSQQAALEHLKNPPPGPRRMFIDPDKLIAARKAGVSAWQVHEKAMAGDFVPAKPYDVRAMM